MLAASGSFVRLAQSGGTLMLFGNDANNDAQVIVDGNRVTVVGLNGTCVAGDNSSFDLDDADNVFTTRLTAPVTDVAVSMRGGHDSLNIFGGNVSISGDARINMGAGSDTLSIQNAYIGDDLVIDANNGHDTVSLLRLVVRDDVDVRGGYGDDVIGATLVRAGDDMVIKGQSGDDALALIGTRTGDDLVVDGNAGFNGTLLVNAIAGDDVNIEGGDNEDIVVALGLRSGDDVRIDTEGGTDVVLVTGLQARDNTRIETDSGADLVVLADLSGTTADALLDFAGPALADIGLFGGMDDGSGMVTFEDVLNCIDVEGDLDDILGGTLGHIGFVLADQLEAALQPIVTDDVKIDTGSGNDLVAVLGRGIYDELDVDGESGYDRLLITRGQRADDIDEDDFEVEVDEIDDIPDSILMDLVDNASGLVPELLDAAEALGEIPTRPTMPMTT